jgi:hypothetical protein
LDFLRTEALRAHFEKHRLRHLMCRAKLRDRIRGEWRTCYRSLSSKLSVMCAARFWWASYRGAASDSMYVWVALMRGLDGVRIWFDNDGIDLRRFALGSAAGGYKRLTPGNFGARHFDLRDCSRRTIGQRKIFTDNR